jgi:putative ABC transport system substrate-binding protein
MRRREFITVICATTVAWPLIVRADVATKSPLIAVLSAITKEANSPALAAAARLPAIYGFRDHVDAGGLASYGVNLSENFYRAATYVRKILKGANPGDLPVEFPTKLELIVNNKAARALGLNNPPSVLVRADEVIE